MCGAPKEQTVTQKTELDPALRRLLYGGTISNPRGGFGAQPVAPVETSTPMTTDSGMGQQGGSMYAAGGYVAPQQGIASLNQGQMPMMNGQLPNLSDPMTAATLAMAAQSPQMRYGNVMGTGMPTPMGTGMPTPMGYAMGGYVEGPGTGKSDSIQAQIYQNGMPVQEARLSDGEFVMTENAVRGAGDGDREKGAARMYELMRQFERGGRV